MRSRYITLILLFIYRCVSAQEKTYIFHNSFDRHAWTLEELRNNKLSRIAATRCTQGDTMLLYDLSIDTLNRKISGCNTSYTQHCFKKFESRHIELNYDNSWRLIKELCSSPGLDISIPDTYRPFRYMTENIFEYNSNGTIVSKKFSRFEINKAKELVKIFEIKKEYFYDENGRTISIYQTRDTLRELTKKIEYKFDDKKRIKEELHYWGTYWAPKDSVVLNYTLTWDYMDEGIVKTTIYTDSSQLNEVEYLDQNMRIIAIRNFYMDKDYGLTEWKYTSENQTASTSSFEDGKLVETTYYTYNSKGLPVETWTIRNGIVTEHIKYVY